MLVEEAGKPLYSSWLSQFSAATGETNGVRWVGGRRVRWWLSSGWVTLAFKTASAQGDPVLQNVELTATPMPAGGSRWWWLCPGCRRRTEMLYLPSGVDALACRLCHGLKYSSQYPRGRGTRRRPRRPQVVYDWLLGRKIFVGHWRRR